MPLYFDWTYFVYILPALILTMYAQNKVNTTFNHYSSVTSHSGYTGAEVARLLLNSAGINDVTIEHIRGNLTDHYDPRNKVLRLSDVVYSSHSIAALGVAAHETGHAMQHNKGYAFLNFRNSIFPIASFSSRLSGPLIMLGFFLGLFLRSSFANTILLLGIILFGASVLFQIVTLPVEFNASARAIDMLEENSILSSDEIPSAKKVLSAAALTYVASAAVAIASLLRHLVLFNNRRND